MYSKFLKDFYESDASRFWNPRNGMVGRDLTIYPLLKNYSGSVLEYGSGSGSLLLNLALESRFNKLIGVDISETALNNTQNAWHEIAVQENIPIEKITLITPLEDTLPSIESESIDIILSLDTIEHVLNPYTVMDEFYRIGKKNSIFIVSVPNYGYIKYVLQLFLGRQPITGGGHSVKEWRQAGWDGWHLHTFTRQSLSVLLEDCGWHPIIWTGYGDRGKQFGLELLRRKFPAMWSGALTVVCHHKS